jgi:transcriptional regulator with XRE-family HTH domain
VREERGLSLQSVDRLCDHEFRAATLASYERGHRLISIVRLARLANIYDVPVDQLLPVLESPNAVRPTRAQWFPPDGRPEPTGVTIDMARLRPLNGPDADLLRRVIGSIVRQRSQISGLCVTIRLEDVAAIGRILGRTESGMRQHFAELNLLALPVGMHPSQEV